MPTYSDLKIARLGVEIDLGHNRTHTARMIGANEYHAICRALPEPEIPIVDTNAIGEPVRDEREPGYLRELAAWQHKHAAVIVAVSIGYTCQTGAAWNPKHLNRPYARDDDKSLMKDTPEGRSFARAEENRRKFAADAAADLIGDGEIEGALGLKELELAFAQVQTIDLQKQIDGSGPGNSGSADGPDAEADSSGPSTTSPSPAAT